MTGVATETSPRLRAIIVSAWPATNSAASVSACHGGCGPGPGASGSSAAKQTAAATFITNVVRHTPARVSVARFSDSAAATYSTLLSSGNKRCSGRAAADDAIDVGIRGGGC